MSLLATYLPLLLTLAAVGQGMIALLNLSLVRLMHWEEAVQRMPLLVREVFHVHGWFVSITLLIFATLTGRFATVLSTMELGRWLAAGIAVFWGIRTVIQVLYYSPEHRRGQPARVLAHVTLLLVYSGFTTVYGLTAAGVGHGGLLIP